MPHPFRFEPPEPRPGSLLRPRLVRSLLARWDHRVTAVVAGPGLGKTTLLAQAMAENRLAPRGRDVWLAVDAADASADGLARDLLAALDRDTAARRRAERARGRVVLRPRAVADRVRRLAPVDVCFVLDDVESIPPGSSGSRWLAALVGALPANGHLLLAGRAGPPIPVARFVAQGALVQVREEELLLAERELDDMAARTSLDRRRLDATGGWPALAALVASGAEDLACEYLREEVLEPLGPERRHVLAAVAELGGADDGLATAALGRPVCLARALAGIPLVDVTPRGWWTPHPLWDAAQPAPSAPAERAELRRRAVAHETERGRYDRAITLIRGSAWPDLDELLPDVLRAACLAGARPPVEQLERWRELSPGPVRASASGRLAEALRLSLIAPRRCAAPLRAAAGLFRDQGDVEGELAALATLVRTAWAQGDPTLLVGIDGRLDELAGRADRPAEAVAAARRAVLADLEGDDETVLTELDGIAPDQFDAAWQATWQLLRICVLASAGDVDGARSVLDRLHPDGDSELAFMLETLDLCLRWLEGEVDAVVDQLSEHVARLRAGPVVHRLATILPLSGHMLARVGRVDAAHQHLAETPRLPRSEGRATNVEIALAHASLAVARGDEERAAALMSQAATPHAVERGIDRHVWRHTLALGYVVVPEIRARWDALPLTGRLAEARRLSAAVVAARAGKGQVLRDLILPPLGVVRAALHYRFAADLAVGLEAVGRTDGRALLEALGNPGRDAVRDIVRQGQRRARSARALLAAVPTPPPTVTELRVLGPLELRRHGGPIDDPALRRRRPQALLAYLVAHRDTTRGAVVAALWPDLDERSAGNNLRVTLTYLLRALEPWRNPGEPPFLLRTTGERVHLVTGDGLRIDTDEFDRHVAAAARAEADGTPSLALQHNLAAVDLYRGELHAGLEESHWLGMDRDRYRIRFVAAATRAAQLLAASGGTDDNDAADAVAHRAIAVDPWAEDAYAVLVTTALRRGNRSAARQSLDRCLRALADLGVEPSEAVRRLLDQLRAPRGEPARTALVPPLPGPVSSTG